MWKYFTKTMKHLIAQGAEARLFLENDRILKNRFRKTYRLDALDSKLRGFRTRREAKVLEKLKMINFPSPALIQSDDKEDIVMQKIEGKLIKDVLEKSEYKRLCSEIGKKIAILHNNSIIHGDLTSSNMILGNEIYFIDFGLSFFSEKAEDKAVDLHVLKEALSSKHYRIGDECFKAVIESYKKEAKDSYLILKRLEAVEKRGRYRAKHGS